jgi:hypothetical protein
MYTQARMMPRLSVGVPEGLYSLCVFVTLAIGHTVRTRDVRGKDTGHTMYVRFDHAGHTMYVRFDNAGHTMYVRFDNAGHTM